MGINKFDNFYSLKSVHQSSKVTVPFKVYSKNHPGAYSIDINAYIFMQFFWITYFKPFGIDFLKQQLNIADKETKELVECCIYNIPYLIDAEISYFEEFLYNIGEPVFELNDFRSEMAVFGVNNIHHFIREFYNSPLINRWHILLAYFVYRHDFHDTSDNDSIFELQKALHNLLKRLTNDGIVSNPIFFVKAGLIKANKILRHLDLLTFDSHFKPSPNPPLTGTFFLSPRYLHFMDGYIWLYHPKFPDGTNGHLPFRYNSAQSRRVFSNITQYLFKQLPSIYVESKNGRITKVLSPLSLTECIKLIEQRLSQPDIIQCEAKKSVQRRDISKSETKSIIKNFKSKYLDYLCSLQIEEYKVVCCTEQRTTASGADVTEYSFIFTIKSTPRITIIVFENVNLTRSTYVIKVNTVQYDGCIDKVFAYFASEILNKRQKIAQGNLRINHTGIYGFERLFHRNYLSWCDSIKQLIY